MTGTVYAGVPATFQLSGGKRPYSITTSEPSLLAFPTSVDESSVTVLPANPGVIDAGLSPGDLPVRTVIIHVRDANGNVAADASIKVAQNFLTGYGVSYSSNCASASATAAGPAACPGGDTLVTLTAVTNGNLFGNKLFKFEVLKGPIQFMTVSGQQADSVTVQSDHAGQVKVFLRVAAGVPTQIATFRVTDVASGVSVDEAIAISQGGPARSVLTAIPDTFTFTGALTTQCGTGVGDFLVFDGLPPYTAASSNPNVQVTPTVNNANPGRFTISDNNPTVCLDGATVIVTDSTGARATVTVNTKPGTTAPPPPIVFAVQPTAVTLACGTAGSVTVIGGSGQYFANSTHPRVSAIVSGNTVTISRLAGDAVGVNYPLTGTVTVSDGVSAINVSISVPANCP